MDEVEAAGGDLLDGFGTATESLGALRLQGIREAEAAEAVEATVDAAASPTTSDDQPPPPPPPKAMTPKAAREAKAKEARLSSVFALGQRPGAAGRSARFSMAEAQAGIALVAARERASLLTSAAGAALTAAPPAPDTPCDQHPAWWLCSLYLSTDELVTTLPCVSKVRALAPQLRAALVAALITRCIRSIFLLCGGRRGFPRLSARSPTT